MKKTIKIFKEKGITLIALIVSIIIMIILAGITLSTLAGKDGLISKAKKAVEYYEKAQEDEKLSIDKLYTKLASLGEKSGLTEAEMKDTINEIVYPIGSIYMSMNEVDPSTIIGGEWEKIEGKFLLGSSEKYKIGTEGGEEEHILTVAEMPSHNHEFSDSYYDTINNGEFGYVLDHYCRGHNYIKTSLTESAGENQPHNNMPPYLAINIWQRVA